MPEYDLVIRGGTVVDGTGLPRIRADVGIKNGRVAMVSGRIAAGGAKELDASGCIVAPGAIDLHTHYDAQLNWDPYASLSGWFGVTSLTVGQCGFGFAPTRPEDRDLNMRMMNRIEAIPLESMRQGMRWDWETFPEYMDSLDRQGLGVNVGALVPFSPLRGYVLGMMEARERTSVTEAELNQMKQILRDSMKAGAFGISADKNLEDRPEDGSWLPSHVASKEEFLGLARVMREFGVGQIGWTIGISDDRPEQRDMLAEMARISGRPLHVVLGDDEGYEWLEQMRQEGLPILAQQGSVPTIAEFKLSEYNLFDYMPNWVQPLVGTKEERIAKLSEDGIRDGMKKDVIDRPHPRTDWAQVQVVEVALERNLKYEGLSIADIATAEGKHPLDAFLDIALDEDLETEFAHPADAAGRDEARAERLSNPFVHISVSDGGAHTRFLVNSVWPVYFLAHWIRDYGLMSLEQGHQKMSALPAWFSDMKNRGTLRVGDYADIMIYNMDELGLLYDKPRFETDFPGGEKRLVQKPTGMRYIIVNGAVTFIDNECTGALPGKLLRSYDMIG
ncbi:MAG: amidohydrolase family protein [SAR202 cluster bacterium]|nr:amidohydrolase family protein [SAR202 cluster bacterium]|tara:strand:- start:2321 stop:4000 length:1680 start_codon:yes stop_codon:yes gene_type:complete